MSQVKTLALSAIVALITSVVGTTQLDLSVLVAPPYVRSVRFQDAMRGWVAGYRGVFYTADGGRSWRKLDVQIATISRFNGSARRNTGVILLADAQGIVVRGDTALWSGSASNQWKSVDLGDRADELAILAFADHDHGFAAEWNGTVYRTNDGGRSWEIARRAKRRDLLGSLAVQPGGDVWALGYGGLALRSRDQGKTWAPLLATDENYTSLCFLDKWNGWLGSRSGRIYATSDGGDSWRAQGSPLPSQLKTLARFDEMEAWAIGYDGGGRPLNMEETFIFHTCDGAAHWKLCSVPVKDYLIDIQGVGPGEAWAVGRNGAALHTRDHGETWTSVVLPW